jgi:hypothetical protein
MTVDPNDLKRWIEDIAILLEQNSDPDPKHYNPFVQEPELVLPLVELIEAVNDDELDVNHSYYSTCIFVLEICVAQLQSGLENGSKQADKILKQLMSKISKAIHKGKHSLSFWLPVLNSFYEVHIELSPELKNAYFELAGREENNSPDEEIDHLNAIREMISELSNLSVFDIAESFFAQSYAMPADFFIDLIFDLYSIDEGQDIALLALLHPKKEVRDVVIATHEQLIEKIPLTSTSLRRLQVIKNWYPTSYHKHFNRWLKIQRKKGVVFSSGGLKPSIHIKATEIDGSGAQGIFLHLKINQQNRLCGLLFKQDLGIRDAWITPEIPEEEVAKYYDETFDSSVTLREVDVSYLLMMIGHFLALTIEKNEMPNLHLLEIQEMLGLPFQPHAIDVPYLIEQLSVQIIPFTSESLQQSLKRSKCWIKSKRFTSSWYIENAHVDKLVNRCCSFVDGVKVCALQDAMTAVMEQELETHRDKWLFHFLWTALWAKAKARKNERLWQDSFFIAYAIHTDYPLMALPIMQQICHQTIINSIETMHERRTHLT